MESALYLLKCSKYAIPYFTDDLITMSKESFPQVPTHLAVPLFHYSVNYLDTEQKMTLAKTQHCILQTYNHIFIAERMKSKNIYEATIAARSLVKKKFLNDPKIAQHITADLHHITNALSVRVLLQNDVLAADLYDLVVEA